MEMPHFKGTHIHIHIYLHIYKYTYIYTCICAYVCVLKFSSHPMAITPYGELVSIFMYCFNNKILQVFSRQGFFVMHFRCISMLQRWVERRWYFHKRERETNLQTKKAMCVQSNRQHYFSSKGHVFVGLGSFTCASFYDCWMGHLLTQRAFPCRFMVDHAESRGIRCVHSSKHGVRGWRSQGLGNMGWSSVSLVPLLNTYLFICLLCL